MKDLCVKLSGVGSLLICIPVMFRIHAGDKFNPASFFLWSALSLVCVIVLIRAKKGGYMIMAGYVLSDFSIGIYAYIKNRQFNFASFEWFIVGLTAICAIIYARCELRKNYTPAVIANGVALMIAGVPQVVDSFRNPYSITFTICGLYMLVSVLAYYGERNFNGKFIPGLSIVYWVVFMTGLVLARMQA